ncbi:MAG: hypothetical protein KDK36_04385 [Leptospiraceae bacterium]|nr:hypothetical protein [Leptospiraceae bacterium]
MAPNNFIFIIKEKSINGKKIPINPNQTEKSKKNDFNWLFSGIIQNYLFEKFDSSGKIQKFHVRPKANFPDSFEGELWINENNNKIVRIIKRPVILPKGFEKYRTEIFFESTLEFQEPSYTKLNAIYYEPDGTKKQARVEAIFTNYLFNFDINKWKE